MREDFFSNVELHIYAKRFFFECGIAYIYKKFSRMSAGCFGKWNSEYGYGIAKSTRCFSNVELRRKRGFAIQRCSGSRTHSNVPLAGLLCTRLQWFEYAFQCTTSGASIYKAALVRAAFQCTTSGASIHSVSNRELLVVFAILFVDLFLLCIYFYRFRIWFLGDKNMDAFRKARKIYDSKSGWIGKIFVDSLPNWV